MNEISDAGLLVMGTNFSIVVSHQAFYPLVCVVFLL